jgi:hypothetical protein
MQDLMLYDPSKRPTAAQVLQYPFFMKGIQVPATLPPAGYGSAPVDGEESAGLPSGRGAEFDSGDAAGGPYGGVTPAPVEPPTKPAAAAPGYSFASGYGTSASPAPAAIPSYVPSYGASAAPMGRIGSGETDESSKYSKIARYAPGKPVGGFGVPSYVPAVAPAPAPAMGAYGIPAYGSLGSAAVGASKATSLEPRRSGGQPRTFVAAGMANLGGSSTAVGTTAMPAAAAAPIGYGRHKF